LPSPVSCTQDGAGRKKFALIRASWSSRQWRGILYGVRWPRLPSWLCPDASLTTNPWNCCTCSWSDVNLSMESKYEHQLKTDIPYSYYTHTHIKFT